MTPAVPGSFVVPDCCMILGVDARFIRYERRSYRIDEWGQPPVFTLEVASESTANKDLREKREIYARMGAREYWRLDVTGGDYYGEPLVGERSGGRRIRAIRAAHGSQWRCMVSQRGLGSGLLFQSVDDARFKAPSCCVTARLASG